MAVALLLATFLLGGARSAEAVWVTGVEGSYVDIRCVHSHAETNVKYFCRGACREVDVLVTSRRPDPTGKYSIRDGGNIFYVKVKNLRMEDSGTYYCGIQRVGVDTYNQVNLRVNERAWDGVAVSVTGDVGTDVDIRCVHIYAQTNVRYFCKGACRDVDVLVTSRRPDPTGKYRIRDEGNIFYVTVKNLRVEDSGLFYCGVQRAGVDTCTPVILTVNERNAETKDSWNEGTTLTSILTVLLPVVMAVVGIFSVFLLTFCLIKRWRAGHRQNTDGASDYVTMMTCVTPGARLVCHRPAAASQGPGLCSQVLEGHCQSARGGLGDYDDVDAPTQDGQYQRLDLGGLENHVYHTVCGRHRPEDGPQKDNGWTPR